MYIGIETRQPIYYIYRALFSVYRAHLSVHRAFLSVCRAHLSVYRNRDSSTDLLHVYYIYVYV